MSIARINVEKLRDIVSVRDFGAKGDGATDDTAAIQATINSTAGPIAVYIPTGVYKVTSTITIAKDRVKLYGDGVASRILFVPTTNAVCFLYDKGSDQSFQHIMQDIAFYSTDTTYTKTAIKLVNVGSCLFDNVQTFFPHWFGAGSIFMHILGRDVTSIRKLTAFADKPIRISPIPAPHTASGIGIDHFHFQDCYLGNTTSANPLITIDDNVILSDVTFDGYQAWVGGSHGLYWDDTLSTAVSFALNLNNVRHEQLVGTTGWAVYINRTGTAELHSLNIKNLRCNVEGNGVYLRKVRYSVLDDVIYAGAQTAYDINNTNSICQVNVVATDNTATISISASRLAGKSLSGGNVTEYLSSAPSGSGLTQRYNPSATLGFSQLEPKNFTVNASSAIDFSTNALKGLVFIYAADTSAVMAVNGTGNSTRLLAQSDAGYFGTSVGSANYNLYWDGGTSRYKLQNNTGGNVSFYVQTMGQGER